MNWTAFFGGLGYAIGILIVALGVTAGFEAISKRWGDWWANVFVMVAFVLAMGALAGLLVQ